MDTDLLGRLDANPALGGSGEGFAPPPAPAPPPPGPRADLLARLDLNPALGGRPEWADESQPLDRRVGAVLHTHALAGSEWDAARDDLGRRFPGVDAGRLESQFRLSKARAAASQMAEPWLVKAYSAVPGAGTVKDVLLEREYGKAARRIAAGQAEPKDYDFVAQFERLGEIRKTESLGAGAARGLSQVPAMVVEYAAGARLAGPALRGLGLTTAAGKAIPAASNLTAAPRLAARNVIQAVPTPMLWADRAVQNNAAAGRDPDDLRGVPPAVALGAIQNAVLGRVQGRAQALPGGRLARAAGAGALGTGEAGVADALASGLDDAARRVTGVSLEVGTKYGTFGELARGEDGGLKRLAVQAITFSGFALMHGKDPKGLLKRVAAKLDESPQAAAAEVSKIRDEVGKAAAEPPAPSEPPAPEVKPAEPAEPTPGAGPAEPTPAAPAAEPAPRPLRERPVAEWTTEEMRSEAGNRKLPTGGSRAELVARLSEPPEPPPPAPADSGAEPARTPERPAEAKPAPRGTEPAAGGGPETEVDGRQFHIDKLQEVMTEAGLNDRDRRIFLAKALEGLTNAEIGRDVGVSDERVRQLSAAIRKKFKAKYGHDIPSDVVLKKEVVARLKARMEERGRQAELGGPEDVEDVSHALRVEHRREKIYQAGVEGLEGRANEHLDEWEKSRAAGHTSHLEDWYAGEYHRLARAIENRDWAAQREEPRPRPGPGGGAGAAVEAAPAADAADAPVPHPAGRPLTAADYAVPADTYVPGPGRVAARGVTLTPQRDRSKLGRVGDVVAFDPALHAAAEGPGSGAFGAVVAPGRLNAAGEVVKKPVVRRHAEQHEAQAWERARAEQEAADHAAEGDRADEPGGVSDTSFDPAKFSEAEAAAEKMLREGFTEGPGDTSFGAARNRDRPPAAPPAPSLAAHVRESARRFVRGVQDAAAKLAGATAPATRRLSEAAADAIARAAEPQLLAHELGDLRVDQVFAGDARETTRTIAGAVWVERRLRLRKQDYFDRARAEANAGVAARAAGDLRAAKTHFDAANDLGARGRQVDTVVGMKLHHGELGPLESEATFRHWDADPHVNDILGRAERLVTPELESYYREAAGIDAADPILSRSQLPPGRGPRMSLVRADPGEETRTTALAPRRGAFDVQKLRRLGATREMTGHSENGYELDLGAIIKRNYVDRLPVAKLHDLYRTLEAEGLAAWARPGEADPVEGWRLIKGVDPPAGTQAAGKGQTALWVHPDAYGEVRQVLGPDEPMIRLPFVVATTWSALVSTGEFVSHLKNQLTHVFQPGVNPLDTLKALKGLIYGDVRYKQLLVELAVQGSLRGHGADAGVITDLIPAAWGKTAARPGGYRGVARWADPTFYAGKALTLMDRASRIALSTGFDRLLASGVTVENTESNRRDFVNQMGNYSKRTQSRLVAWLRDAGIGPFATAAAQFGMNGLRSLLGKSSLRAETWGGGVRLRAEMLARLSVLPVLAATLNWLAWKRADGDDNTPLGAVKTGTRDGKTSYFDLTNLTGLSRGARESGILALAESQRPGARRAGATWGTGADRAAWDVTMAALHPAVGPAVEVARVLTTGKTVSGIPEAHQLTAAERARGQSQAQYNALAAFWKLNPLLEAWVKPTVDEEAGLRMTPGQKRREGTVYERFMRMGGPFGEKYRATPPGKPLPPR